jgi:hypothetical protein
MSTMSDEAIYTLTLHVSIKGKTKKDAVRDNLISQLNSALAAELILQADIAITGEVTREGMTIK